MKLAILAVMLFNIFLIGFAWHVIRPPKITKPKTVTYTDKSWQL